jgi:hypothetical protein
MAPFLREPFLRDWLAALACGIWGHLSRQEPERIFAVWLGKSTGYYILGIERRQAKHRGHASYDRKADGA